MGELRSGLAEARAGVARLTEGQRAFQRKLGELADGAGTVAGGADELAGGAGEVSEGTGKLTASTKELRAGLDKAAGFLLTTAKATKDPAIGGFYLPSSALDDPRMALARGYYLSEDGRTARLVVLGEMDPFGNESMERAATMKQAAVTAVRDGPLAGSDIKLTGPAATNAELAQLSDDDFGLVAAVALIAVLLIDTLIVRGLVVPAVAALAGRWNWWPGGTR